MKLIFACLLFIFSYSAFCQSKDSLSGIDYFFTPSDSLSGSRISTVGAATSTVFFGMMVTLDQAWYVDFKRGPFHFYQDGDEWLQVDKVGHAWTSYHGARLGDAMLKWAGVEDSKARWYGAPLGFVFLTGIEVLDGFSEEWGFSPTDMIANTAGTGLFLGQDLLWNEQRIQFKYSIEPVDYLSHPEVQARIEDVYGTGIQKLLKDYNAQTYWLSVNPSDFLDEHSKFPQWLNASVGYSADGMLGGRLNSWCDDPDIKPEDCPFNQRIDFSDQVSRERQFFLSADIDLTKIETKSPALRTLFGTLNMIKIPAPALEISDGEIHLRPLR